MLCSVVSKNSDEEHCLLYWFYLPISFADSDFYMALRHHWMKSSQFVPDGPESPSLYGELFAVTMACNFLQQLHKTSYAILSNILPEIGVSFAGAFLQRRAFSIDPSPTKMCILPCQWSVGGIDNSRPAPVVLVPTALSTAADDGNAEETNKPWKRLRPYRN